MILYNSIMIHWNLLINHLYKCHTILSIELEHINILIRPQQVYGIQMHTYIIRRGGVCESVLRTYLLQLAVFCVVDI